MKQVGNPVETKPGMSLDDDGFLVRHGKNCSSVSTVWVRVVESADHFDGRLQVDRVHEVDAHHIGRRWSLAICVIEMHDVLAPRQISGGPPDRDLIDRLFESRAS